MLAIRDGSRKERLSYDACGGADLEAAIAEAVSDAAAVGAADPLTFVGLRLLQHSERAVRTADDVKPDKLTRATVDRADVAARLSAAETELEVLREQLHELEVAEALKAMQLLLCSRGDHRDVADGESRVLTNAAVVIQAGFHGMVARSYCRHIRPIGRLALTDRMTPVTLYLKLNEDDAANRIQACFHGWMTRRWRESPIRSP